MVQIVRGWMIRSNAAGPEGLIDRKAPGRPSRLIATHRTVLAAMIESGPTPAIHGVVRWRNIDLCQWLSEEFRVSSAKQTLSRELRAMGIRKLSVRLACHRAASSARPARQAAGGRLAGHQWHSACAQDWLPWRDVPSGYGSPKTIYIRFTAAPPVASGSVCSSALLPRAQFRRNWASTRHTSRRIARHLMEEGSSHRRPATRGAAARSRSTRLPIARGACSASN